MRHGWRIILYVISVYKSSHYSVLIVFVMIYFKIYEYVEQNTADVTGGDNW